MDEAEKRYILEALKNKIFSQVMCSLEDFEQYYKDVGNDTFYSPYDLSVSLSSSEFQFLKRFKNGR